VKCLVLNTHDLTGGAARAAFRLHKGLLSAGVDASMLVREKSGSDPSVITFGNKYSGRIQALCDSLPIRTYPKRQLNNFSPAVMPSNVVAKVQQIQPDIVHLHWLAEGFIRLESLARITCPIVWTLHDSWPFTGGCHLPGECRRYQNSCGCCPVLGSSKADDLSRRVWSRKKHAWANLTLTMVAPSRWLAERVKSSSLFSKSRIEVIPNGVDANWYSPGIRCQEKEKLGFPIDRHLILFGGKNSLHDHNKGFDLLFSALRALPDKIRKNSDVVVFGDRKDWQFPDCDIKIHNLGIVTDEAFLVTIYRAADVLVLPSRQENLPNVLLEAMSCGTPCVAFDIGGVGEIIDNNVTGYVCKPYEIGEMSAAIASIVSDQTLKDDFSDQCRAKIMRDFALDIVTSRYLGLYSELHV